MASAVLRSHLPGAVLSESTPLSGLVDDTVPPPSTLAATAAFEEAGLGPSDLDVVECQDTDAARELLSYEELGLCQPGGSAALIESGNLMLMGSRVVDKGDGYQRARQAFSMLLRQYGDMAFLVSKNIGGEYMNRDHRGDANARDPFVPVKGTKQRDALKFVQDHAA